MSELDFHIPGAAWSGNHLLFAPDNPVVEKKLRRPRLSPSVADSYNGCPARTAGDRLLPRVEGPFEASVMGTSFHAVMEDLYGFAPEERTREKATELLRKQADEMWSTSKLEKQDKQSLEANQKGRTEWVDTIETWIDGQFAMENPWEIDVYANEFLLDDVLVGAGVGGDGIPLKGFVDRTDWITDADGNRRLDIVDYKAGKPKVKPDLRYGDAYGDQQRIYFVGYTEKTGEKPAGARLMFPRGPQAVTRGMAANEKAWREGVRQIDVSDGAIRQTLINFRHGWDVMNISADRRSYEAIPSALCSWCPLVNSCPMGKQQALRQNKPNAVEARKNAPSEVQLGIPTLRPGMHPVEAFGSETPGVTVPKQAGETDDAIRDARAEAIPPAGDDLFPETIPSTVPVAEGQVGSDIDRAAHLLHETGHMGSAPSTERTDMTDGTFPEGKPFDEEVAGMLNLNSYAAAGIAGLVSASFTHLTDQGVKPTPEAVSRFARVLARIVQNAQQQTTGTRSFQRGASTRLRGFLFTRLEKRPAPFGGSASDWEAWVTGTERFLIWALGTTSELWQNQPAPNATDYLFFASDAQNQGTPQQVFAPAGA